MAAFYERAGQLESVTIWKEATELDPEDATGWLGLARAALRFGDQSTAKAALAKADGSSTPEYHRLAAAVALLDRDARGQEAHLAKLAELAPDDERVRLNLATVRLAAPHHPQAPAARAALLDLARGEKARMRAVTELLADTARRWPGPSEERDATLRALASALAPARGPLLALPSQVDDIERLIAYALTQPSPEAEDIISLANWMSLNGQTETALLWMDTLSPALRQNPLLRTAQAEFAIRARDWDRLKRVLLAGAWGPVPTETVEQAFRARAVVRGEQSVGVIAGWSAAIDAGKASPVALRMLLRLAELWEWPTERRLVLLTIARTTPREGWAWRQLIAHALAREDAEQLWQIYLEWRRALPTEPMVQIEAAIMGFLLGRRPVPDTVETAGYVERQPSHAGAAVAHALALWRAQRVGEAVSVLDGQPATDFSEPRYALARGLVLAEAGRPKESEEMFLRLGQEYLLPEERALVAAARARNRGAQP